MIAMPALITTATGHLEGSPEYRSQTQRSADITANPAQTREKASKVRA